MLDFTDLNYLAVVVAWLVNIGVGSFWYSPAGFGKTWSKLSGVDIMKIPQDEANRAIGWVVASSFLQALTLAVILNSLAVDSAAEGLKTGLFLWAGLVAATTVGTTLYSRRGWHYWWLNSSFFLVVMAINSLLLSVWT